MNLLDALSKVDSNSWFRPACWKGSGQAYCIQDGAIFLVPSRRGGDLSMTPYVKYILDEWEILSPTTVLDELEGAIINE